MIAGKQVGSCTKFILENDPHYPSTLMGYKCGFIRIRDKYLFFPGSQDGLKIGFLGVIEVLGLVLGRIKI